MLRVTIQYNTIQILLSTSHGGFPETNINSTGNKKKTITKTIKKLFTYKFMTSKFICKEFLNSFSNSFFF